MVTNLSYTVTVGKNKNCILFAIPVNKIITFQSGTHRPHKKKILFFLPAHLKKKKMQAHILVHLPAHTLANNKFTNHCNSMVR